MGTVGLQEEVWTRETVSFQTAKGLLKVCQKGGVPSGSLLDFLAFQLTQSSGESLVLMPTWRVHRVLQAPSSEPRDKHMAVGSKTHSCLLPAHPPPQ